MNEQRTPEDRVRDEVLAAIARSGKCYVNEARAMAAELIALRDGSPARPDASAKVVWIPSGAFPNDVVYAYTKSEDVPATFLGLPNGTILMFREVTGNG